MSTTIATRLPELPALSLTARLRELYARRETIMFLVTSNLRAGHRDKVFGRLWSLLDPLLFMLVYLVVFGYSFRQMKGSVTEFVIYLLCGVMSWRFFDGSITAATGCIRSNRGLIHEINFPKAIFPTSACLARLSDFIWGFAAMFIIILVVGRSHFSLQMLWIPAIMIVQLVFTLGMCFLVAYMGAFFADTANLIGVGLRLMFYMSPIFYRVSRSEGGIVPDQYLPYYMLNPLACFFEAFRACILKASPPDPVQMTYATGAAIAAFAVGFYVFSRGEGHFAKYI